MSKGRSFLYLSFSLVAITFAGCTTYGQRDFIARHPELSLSQIADVNRRTVRNGQSMEMVKAMFGTPYRQVAPGASDDILLYWYPNRPNSRSTYTTTKEDESALTVAVAEAVKDVAEQATRDERGRLFIVYFAGGKVAHWESRREVYRDEIDKVVNAHYGQMQARSQMSTSRQASVPQGVSIT